MSLAGFSIGDSSLAQLDVKDGGKKAPPKRTATAMTDRRLAPEPR